MRSPVLLVDFYDSFTFNIAAELASMGVRCVTKRFNHVDFSDLETYQGVILGPGPGHPSDYAHKIDWKNLLKKRVVGICLGHQLIHMYLGREVTPASNILHGQTELLPKQSFISHIPNTRVQRYNSLAVRFTQLNDHEEYITNDANELMAYRYESLLSYQFHPESVGTICRSDFFEIIVRFFYNK